MGGGWGWGMVKLTGYHFYKGDHWLWGLVFVKYGLYPASSLHKSIAGCYPPVRVADGPITARCIFIKNASYIT